MNFQKLKIRFMKASKFIRAYFFILIGFALASGINYLDMRQFEAQIPGYATAGWSPSDASQFIRV